MPNLNTPEASSYLRERHGVRREPKTLRNLRLRGGGPGYLRDLATGEVLYPSEGLDAWAAELLRPARCTTDERGLARRGRPPREAAAGLGQPPPVRGHRPHRPRPHPRTP